MASRETVAAGVPFGRSVLPTCQSLMSTFSNSPLPLPMCFVCAVTSLKRLIGSTDPTGCQQWKSEAWGEQLNEDVPFFLYLKSSRRLPHQKEESARLAFEMFTLYYSQLLFNTFNSAVFLVFFFFSKVLFRPKTTSVILLGPLIIVGSYFRSSHLSRYIAAVALPRRDGLSSPNFISRLPHNSISLVAHRWRDRRCCSALVVQDRETSKNETRSCVTGVFRRRTQLGELHHVLLQPQNYPDYLLRVCHFFCHVCSSSVCQKHWLYIKMDRAAGFKEEAKGGSAENTISIVWLARQKESRTVFVFCGWSTLLVKENHLIGALHWLGLISKNSAMKS